MSESRPYITNANNLRIAFLGEGFVFFKYAVLYQVISTAIKEENKELLKLLASNGRHKTDESQNQPTD